MKEDRVQAARELLLQMEGSYDGMAWVDLLLQKQARIAFETHWVMFMLGQIGGQMEVVKLDPSRLEESETMLNAFEEGITDLEEATKAMIKVEQDILANARRNLRKFAREARDRQPK